MTAGKKSSYDPEKRHDAYVARAERAKATQREWNAQNSMHRRAHNANVRAAALGISERLTDEDIEDAFASTEGACGYCSEAADSIDHVIPLARGGANSFENVLPSCTRCNSSKGKKTISEWVTAAERKGAVRERSRLKDWVKLEALSAKLGVKTASEAFDAIRAQLGAGVSS